jgi:PAS domain S-box-containing protein
MGDRILNKDDISQIILSALSDAVIVIDNEGKIVYWNPASEKVFGYNAEDTIEKKMEDLIIPLRFHEEYRNGLRGFISGGEGPFVGERLEVIAKRKNGNEFPAELSISPVQIKGHWHAVGIVRDITERKEAERRVHDTNSLLKMFTQNISRKTFLNEAVKLIRNHCGCGYAGIRVLDEKGNIPFESYDGYSEEFISCESPLSIYSDQCVCVRAISSRPDPQDANVRTQHGSFFYYDFVDFIGRLGEEEKTRYRGTCALHGFRSVAVIPVRYYEKMVGLIHLADEKVGVFSQGLIEFMETLSYIIGEAITKFDAQEELARLASAAESAADAIVITDNKGAIQYVNPAFEHITGYREDEVIGKSLHILDSGEQAEDFYMQIRETLRQQGLWKGKLLNRKKDGTIYQEECTISAVRDSTGDIINYVAIKRDITEKARLESIAEAVNTMNNMGYIFSGIRHEIGNPINSIKMTLSMLRGNISRFELETVERYLDRCIDEIRRVEYLLKAFKNFNMYEHLEPQHISIRSFMEKFLALIKNDFSRKDIDISLDVSQSADFCYADPRALHQVLLNILVNAGDACNGRKDPHISISVSGFSDLIGIRIQDNGCGMAEDQIRNLFRPFFTTKPDGTGLGLVIAKRMLAMMGGTIEIRSKKGEGTVVDIFLPRRSVSK